MITALSALTRRVQTATLLAYGFTALLVLLGPVLYFTMRVADGSHGDDVENPPAVLLALNPISIVADATAGENTSFGVSNTTPLAWARDQVEEAKRINDDSWFTWFPEDNFRAEFRFVNDRRTGFPAWAVGSIGLAVIAGLLSTLAVRRLRTPAEAER